MDFPEKSHSSTNELFTWDEVRVLLDKEATRRAEYIARIIIELSSHYGEEVKKIASEVIYQIGFKKGQNRAILMKEAGKPNDLENLANLVSHKNAQLYLGNQVKVEHNWLLVTEDYCPLPRKWKEMGLPDDQIEDFCQLFDQVDKGMIEGYNQNFEVHLSGCRDLARNGICQMLVEKVE